MKDIKGISLWILCLLLLIVVISESNMDLYFSVDNIINTIKNDDKNNEENVIDISDIAYGLNDRIDLTSINTIAVNIERVEVFDGLTIEELSAKLNKSLKGVIANKGDLIATRCIELGIDPYMAVAIMLHETGCTWTCSKLARVNYNVGGMRGNSGWQKFDTIEDGINGFLNNLYKNYYNKGLTTPEAMAKKYAGGSTSWPVKIRNYMKKIKAK